MSMIMGVSMGADTILEAAAELANVGALMADSAFADVRSIIVPSLHARLPGFFDYGIFTAAHVLYGLDMDLRPSDSVHALPASAFLFIVFDGDTCIATDNSRRLWRASGNPESQLVLIHCQTHIATYKTDRGKYLANLFSFVDQQMAEHG